VASLYIIRGLRIRQERIGRPGIRSRTKQLNGEWVEFENVANQTMSLKVGLFQLTSTIDATRSTRA